MSHPNSSHKPSPIVFCCLAILLGYFGINVIQTVAEGHNHQDQVAIVEQQIQSLKGKKQSLQQELDNVKSQSFVESEARNKLNMARDNEVVVVFPQQSSVLSATNSASKESHAPSKQSLGYIEDWYKLFFK